MPDDITTGPTSERIQDLLHIWRVEVQPGPHSIRDPGSYHSWDDLLEFPEHQDYGDDCLPMTTEEWEWCRDHFDVIVRSCVQLKGVDKKDQPSGVAICSDPDDGWISFDDEEEGEGITFTVDEAENAIEHLTQFVQLAKRSTRTHLVDKDGWTDLRLLAKKNRESDV